MLYLIMGLIVLACILLYIKYIQFRNTVRSMIDRRTTWRKSRYGFIYFYQLRWIPLPIVKIGRADKPIQRISNQRTAAPFGIHVVACVLVADEIRAENIIHRKYRFERIYNDRRNEWFWLSPRLWLFMLAVRDSQHTVRVRRKVLQ